MSGDSATRDRIVTVAGDMIREHGVDALSVEHVTGALGLCEQRLREFFADKDDLVAAVVDARIRKVLAFQEPMLRELDSLAGLARWRDTIVDMNRAHGARLGCPLGSLVGVLADQHESARHALMAGFALWESYVAEALARMSAKGELSSRADPATLATSVMAALQGGLLLAQTTRDTSRLEKALDMALGYVNAYAVDH